MKKNITRLMMIDDNEDDFIIMRELLAEIPGDAYHIDWASNFEDGWQSLKETTHDLYLIDQNLDGPNEGIELLELAKTNGIRVPMIILTGQSNRELETKTISTGADDYLVKGQFNSQLLERSLRFAIERTRLINELEETKQREAQLRELNSLKRLSSPDPQNEITKQAFGIRSLKQVDPSVFSDLVYRYSELLDLALDQRTYRVDHDLTDKIQEISNELGFYSCSPRDVIELHTESMQLRLSEKTPKKSQAYVEEGRLLLLKLMGHLVLFYRHYYPG